MFFSNVKMYILFFSAEHDSEAKLSEENAIYRHGELFSTYLGKGLADNWSQVCVSDLHFSFRL